MADFIKVSIDDRQIKTKLSSMIAKGKKLSPALKQIGEHLRRSTRSRFDTETDPNGNRWEEVKPSTRKRKTHPKILNSRYMRLRDSNNYQLQGENTLLFGNNLPYGPAHQLGVDKTVNVRSHRTRVRSRDIMAGKKKVASGIGFVKEHRRKMKLPAREYIGFSKEDERETLAILGDHITE